MIRPDPKLSIADQEPAVLLRMLGWGEARGEGSLAVLAVCHTPYNRLGKIGADLKSVMLHPWAYSCFNASDPNRGKLLAAYVTNRESWIMVDTVCTLIEQAGTVDPTHGATHYCTENLWNVVRAGNPKWHDDVEIREGRTKELARIGGHVFAVAP